MDTDLAWRGRVSRVIRIGSHFVSILGGALITLWGLSSGHLTQGARMDALAMADPATTGLPATPAMISRRAELRIVLRALFDDRAVYMRSAVVATLANAADLDVLTARLMKNQDEIATAVKPYWGGDASKTLSRLLKDQATLALALVRTAKGGDRAKLAAAREKSAGNAAALGEFLVATDDSLDAATTAQMLQKNLDLTLREATARLVRDWPADLRAWDERRMQTRLIADTLTNAIATPQANLTVE